MMTAARTIAILLVMTIVAVNAKQLPRTRSKRDFVEIPGRALVVSIVGRKRGRAAYRWKKTEARYRARGRWRRTVERELKEEGIRIWLEEASAGEDRGS